MWSRQNIRNIFVLVWSERDDKETKLISMSFDTQATDHAHWLACRTVPPSVIVVANYVLLVFSAVLAL